MKCGEIVAKGIVPSAGSRTVHGDFFLDLHQCSRVGASLHRRIRKVIVERGLCGSFNDLVRGKNFLNEMIFYFTFTYENTFLKAFFDCLSFIRTKSQFLCGASLRGVNLNVSMDMWGKTGATR
jgi:hypothetical protein